MDLQGKVAIITGASSGIGRAVARDLSSAGVKLVLTARREERLAALAEELGNTVYVVGDIVDPAIPQALIDKAVESFGRCDAVVNNAGIMVGGTIESIDMEKVRKMVRVNIEAAYDVAYTSLKYFKEQGSGHLVNISSILGTKVRDTAGAYAGTKYAIEALTEALRMELAGTGVSASCVEPGLVQTELHEEWDVHPRHSLNIEPPLEPEDIARAVRFVLTQPAHVVVPRVMVLPKAHKI